MATNFAFSQKVDAVDAMLNAARRLSPANMLLENLARGDGEAPLSELSLSLSTFTPEQFIDALLTMNAGGYVKIERQGDGPTTVKLTDQGRNAALGSMSFGDTLDAGRRAVR